MLIDPFMLHLHSCYIVVVDAHDVVGRLSITDAHPACLQDIDSPSSTTGTDHAVSMSVTELTPMLKRKNKKISSAALKKSNSFHVSVSLLCQLCLLRVYVQQLSAL